MTSRANRSKRKANDIQSETSHSVVSASPGQIVKSIDPANQNTDKPIDDSHNATEISDSVVSAAQKRRMMAQMQTPSMEALIALQPVSEKSVFELTCVIGI